MARPTIRDLAERAGVSVATVNRVIGGGPVREATMQRVVEAARDIGFYGLGALQHRVEVAARGRQALAVVIQTAHRAFSARLAAALEAAAQQAARVPGASALTLQVVQLEDLAPERVAALMRQHAAQADALAVLAAEHPLVTGAIDEIVAAGVPVLALGSPLSARSRVGYVGLDSWKVGRTAAWALSHLCRRPGRVGLLVGTHRYRCHDLYESGLRSFLREHPGELELIEPLATFESDAIARELTETLLRTQPDLCGLYVSGGGIGGVMAALRDRPPERARALVTVGHDLLESTRAGLLDGTLTFLISHPFERLAQETIAAMQRAQAAGAPAGGESVSVPFEIYTRENL